MFTMSYPLKQLNTAIKEMLEVGNICVYLFVCLLATLLKIKGASKGSSSDAIEEPFLVPQRTIQSKIL